MIESDIVPEEIYAISFGSPTTDKCGWCGTIGLATGILSFIYTPLRGLKLISGAVGTAAGSGIGYGVARGAVSLRDFFLGRDLPMVYLTTLKDIQKEKLCTLVEE